MRSDMQRVIVERPRRGSSITASTFRRRPRRTGEDLEHLPRTEGMSRGSRANRDHKELSDYLSPLYRFLDGQVGRPWDRVWSEIANTLDLRNVLGQHVKQHIDDHVARHVILVGRVPHEIAHYAAAGLAPVHGLYVDPRTGLLRRHGQRWRHWRRQPNRYEAERRLLDNGHQIHRHRGQWYEITLAPAKTTVEIVEHLHGRTFTRQGLRDFTGDVLDTPTSQLADRYGQHGVIAIAKRQISRREMRRHGLRPLVP